LLQVNLTLPDVFAYAAPALTAPKATLVADTVQKLVMVTVTLKFDGPAVAARAPDGNPSAMAITAAPTRMAVPTQPDAVRTDADPLLMATPGE
jgi:hypothetical protein